MPAVEMPPGVSRLSGDDPAIQGLLKQARCDGYQLRAELPAGTVGPGAAQVILSAWKDGDGSRERPAARRSWTLFVLPSGTTPVGLSADENATAGNNAAHIVRDAAGFVHMVWVDSGRAGEPTGAVYRRASVAEDGRVRFETDPTELARPGSGEWNAYPAVATTGMVVHFVWQAGGSAHYRTTFRDRDGWHWSDEVDTHAPSTGRDIGPAIAVDDAGIQIVTPDGFQAVSHDGGTIWATGRLPLPSGRRVKSASVALDHEGGALFAVSLIVRDPSSFTGTRGSGGYWGLRVVRRARDGTWSKLEDPLAGLPEWAPPASASDDVLVDWTRIAMDDSGGVHLTFHGTAASRVFANDRAYYLWRKPGEAWQRPVSLQDPGFVAGFGFSYAPSLALRGDIALPLTFYDVVSGEQDMGFDAEVGQFRLGERVARPLVVTRYAEAAIEAGEPGNAMSDRFPAAAPKVYQAADGRQWLDVLETLAPTSLPGSAKLIVYQRIDLTGWVPR